MTEHIWVKPLELPGLIVSQYGRENCTPGHGYGPAVRDHFLLHFITEGEGVFSRSGRDYPLGQGQGFLICPEDITSYRASEEDPWSYCWIGFSGVGAKDILLRLGLSVDSPIFSFSAAEEILAVFKDLRQAKDTWVKGHLALSAGLYLLLSKIQAEDAPPISTTRHFGVGRDYVQNGILYIQENYPHAITVSQVAAHLGLHRCYFSTLFRDHTGESPKAFLRRVRMQKAARLLEEGRLTVAEVAKSVGYEDPLLFSRMFREFHGVPPREYRSCGGGGRSRQ